VGKFSTRLDNTWPCMLKRLFFKSSNLSIIWANPQSNQAMSCSGDVILFKEKSQPLLQQFQAFIKQFADEICRLYSSGYAIDEASKWLFQIMHNDFPRSVGCWRCKVDKTVVLAKIYTTRKGHLHDSLNLFNSAFEELHFRIE